MSDPANLRSAGRRPAPLAAPLVVAGAAAAGLALVATVDPGEAGHYPTCPFLAITGLWCPGCGSLRAIHALTRGDVAQAAGLNVLTVLLLPVLVVLWFAWVHGRSTGASRLRAPRGREMVVVAVALVAFAVLRNVPGGAALAP